MVLTFTNRAIIEERFDRPYKFPQSSFLKEGELLTRFTKTDASVPAQVKEFIDFCNPRLLPLDSLANSEYCNIFLNEQNDIIQIIESYRQNQMKERIARALSQKTKSASMTLKSVPNSPIGYFSDKNRTKKENERRIKTAYDYQLYHIVPSYLINNDDIITAVWIELSNLIMQKCKIEKCMCGAYFVKRKNQKTCMFCSTPPSRLRADVLKQLSPDDYEFKRVKDNIHIYLQRNTKYENSKKLMHLRKIKKEHMSNKRIVEWISEIEKQYGGIL